MEVRIFPNLHFYNYLILENRTMNKFTILCGFSLLFFFLACNNNPPNTPQKIESKEIATTLKWSERLALSVMKRNPEAWQTGDKEKPTWNYKIGLLMTAFEQLYKASGDEQYFDYMKTYAETIIDEGGNIKSYKLEEYNIDQINAGKFIFFMYEKTKDERYLKALKTLRTQLEGHPRTNSNGFWHKKIYPYQMWLDGLYMGTPFYAQYNTTFENDDRMDDIIHQYEEIQAHLVDESTGLLYHAWDESKAMDWADKTTGRSPGFWARSMGWYAMAIVDVLDFIPENHPKREQLITYLNDMAAALVKVQDEKTGLWWQVPDQAGREGNYLEASSSSMFVYAFAKGVKKGYLPESYQAVAEKAFDGLVSELIKVHPDGEVDVTNICKSAGLGGDPYRDATYDYYISEPIVTNNLHGTGPFILAALAMDK